MARLDILSSLQNLGFTDTASVRDHLEALQEGSVEDQHNYSRGLARALYAIDVMNLTLAEACNVKPSKFGRWHRGDSNSVRVGRHFHALMVYLFKVLLSQLDPEWEDVETIEDGGNEDDDNNDDGTALCTSSNDELDDAQDGEDDSEDVALFTQYLFQMNMLPPKQSQ